MSVEEKLRELAKLHPPGKRTIEDPLEKGGRPPDVPGAPKRSNGWSPETKKKMAELTRKRMADPVFAAKLRKAASESMKRRRRDPAFNAKLAQAVRAARAKKAAQ